MFSSFESSNDLTKNLCRPPGPQRTRAESTITESSSSDVRYRKSKSPSIRRNASACDSCRQRKIRCSGGQPCTACEWYDKGHLCRYALPPPTWRQFSKLSREVEQYQTIFRKLFPHTTPEKIVDLPRDALLHILSNNQQDPSNQSSPDVQQLEEIASLADLLPQNNLKILEYIPEEDPEDKPLDAPDIRPNISDDVNALSSLTNKPSTFQGVTSLYAALNVMLHIDPKICIASDRLEEQDSGINSSPESATPSSESHSVATTGRETQSFTALQLIDVYFSTFHQIAPLIDEASFRKTYLSCRRTDARWMALMNTIFALGSLAISKADDLSHFAYYRRSMTYLNLASLGDHHFETIQTLGLIGGFYLHYLNQPNMAHCLVGAALRMAASLGLYKNFESLAQNSRSSISLELRRRIWWSLFCLDTWACMSLGRPALGRWGQAISVQLPQGGLEDEHPHLIRPLVESVSFCKVATKIQEALAASPLPSYSELRDLDQELLQWYGHMDAIFKPSSNGTEFTKTLIRWRFQNQRMLLHRPILLNCALKRISYKELTFEDRQSLEICESVARETIKDISSCKFTNNVLSGNGIWYIFQAAMTPLLLLFMPEMGVPEFQKRREFSREQVEITLRTLARLQEWSVTAARAKRLLRQVLAAANSACYDAHHKPMHRSEDLNSSAIRGPLNTDVAASFSATHGEISPNMNEASSAVLWNLVSQTERDFSSDIIGANFDNFDVSFFGGQDLGLDNWFPVFSD